MAVPLLDLRAQNESVRPAVEAAIREVLDAQRFIMGPQVERFEASCARYCQTPHALGVSSGTDALLLALMAEGIGAGDEVITTPFSFFATAGCIQRVGATPVFADVDPATYNIDPTGIEAKISERTRAIIPVHLFGQCADMDPILEIARRHELIVIEDAAQAIGSEYKGRRAGSIGDYGCFSFFPSKNLGAMGDAGLVTTCDRARHERMAILRSHGGAPKYFHAVIGGNFRLDTIQAAILEVKLPRLDEWTGARQANALAYAERLVGVPTVETPSVAPARRHVWNQFTIRVKNGRRDAMRAHLNAAGIGNEVYYPLCLHRQKCFEYLGYGEGTMPHAERASAEVLSIPIFSELTSVQIDEVVSAIRVGS